MSYSEPRVIVIPYPFPPKLICTRCYKGDGASLSAQRTVGVCSDPAHLSRHLKLWHIGDSLAYECSVCQYKGKGKHPLKDVKAHYSKEHSAPETEPGPVPGTAQQPGQSVARGGSARGPGASARGPRAQQSASAGPSLRSARTSAAATSSARAGASRLTTPSPSTSTGAPSYAAVTAAATGSTTTSPRTAAERPTAGEGRVAASSTPDGTFALPKRPLLSLRRPPRPTPPSSGERGVATARRTPERTPPAPEPRAVSRVMRETSLAASTTRLSSPGSPFMGFSQTEAYGNWERQMNNPPGGTPESQAASASSEKSAGTSTAASATRISPSPPPTLVAGNEPVESCGAWGRTRKKPPGETTSSSSRVAGVSRAKSGATQRCPSARPTSGEASAGRRTTTTSSVKSTGAPVRPTLGSVNAPTSIGKGGEPRGKTVACQTPPFVPPRTLLSTPGVAAGEAVVIDLCTPPPATTSASVATLTTTTVTTTTRGSPVMSVGLPIMTRGTPPLPLPMIPVIRETSPVVVDVGRVQTPPEPTSAAVERRPDVGQSSSSSSEGVAGGSWRTRAGRRKRRGVRRIVSDGSSENETPAAAAREESVPPSAALANNIINMVNNILATPPEARRGEVTPPRRGEEGDAPVSTASVNVSHPSAPVDVRGVMGRRRHPRTVVQADGEHEAPALRVDPGRRGVNQRRPRQAAAVREQAPPGRPAPEAVGRQRRRERRAVRDALVERAAAVETLADLEELATSVSEFFGNAALPAGVEAPGAGDRPRGADRRRARRPAEAAAAGQEGAREGEAPADPLLRSRERRANWVREATRIQALYRRNRRKAVREVLQGPAEPCQVPARRIEQYFRRLYCGEDRPGGAGEREAEPPEPATPEDVERLTAPFTEREVDRRLRRMSNSAPGPDGVTYSDLRKGDPGARLLTALFNICARLEAVPASWKNSNTILVYKKGNREDLENWRPLALGDTMPKLFAALVADRLTDWAVAREKLSPAQKGFLRDEGCYEHNFVLQEILTDARRTRRQAVVAWLDLSNAFGSVPHATIRRAFVRSGVPRRVIEIWRSMYDNCTTRVRTAEGFTAPIPIRSGVRQGCPLSPIAFDLAVDSVLRAAAELDGGYSVGGVKWSVLAYADDIALVSDTPEGMKRLLAAMEREALSVGLRFNPAKCATLHIGAGRGGGVLPTRFAIQGQTIPCLAEGEPYRHLGVPTGFSVDQTPYSTIRGLLEDLSKVNQSLLTPWQRLEVVSTFLLPRLDFLLRGAAIKKGPLKAADLQIRRYAKSWLNLPQRASAEVVYLPPRLGGCGLLPLTDLADVLTVAHAYRILTARDAAVRDLAWATLRGVVGRRVGHAPDCDEVASFLSGSLEGRMRSGGEASFWSRVRNAGRRQAERMSVRWKWASETEEMTVACRGARDATVVVPPGARSQVVTRLRSAVGFYYFHTLVRKPDQGKVYEVSSRTGVSNHFIRGGSFTRFADWRFVHRARLDVLPLNGARRWGSGDRRCRRCGAAAETLPHVIGHCGVHAAAIQLRHDAVLHRLSKACRLPGEVRVNRRVEGVQGELRGLRPDLVVRHELSKSVVIVDVTVPFENRLVAFEEARARKVAKYSALAEELQNQGYRVVVTALVVGALGSWDPRNEAVLGLLRISSKYAQLMRRLVVSDTIRWSRDIYVEHVSGVRQYRAPAPPAEEGALAEPPQAVCQRWPAELRGEDLGELRVLCVRAE